MKPTRLFTILVAAAIVLAGLYAWFLFSSPPRAQVEVLGSLPDFSLTASDGRTITRDSLRGRVWIADFVFTRCAGTCPMMQAEFEDLSRTLPKTPRLILVSISVDPEHDTAAVLKREEDARRTGGVRWIYTAPAAGKVAAIVHDAFRLPYAEMPTDSTQPVEHSTRFVLVDQWARIRGYYDALDTLQLAALGRDTRAVLTESSR